MRKLYIRTGCMVCSCVTTGRTHVLFADWLVDFHPVDVMQAVGQFGLSDVDKAVIEGFYVFVLVSTLTK